MTKETAAEARRRVAAWAAEIQQAKIAKKTVDTQVDQQSLDRAADLEVIFEDMSWVDEMPTPIKKPRGPTTDPRSRRQFATWVKINYGISATYVNDLHSAHEFTSNAVASDLVKPATEFAVRPLRKLRGQGYGDHQVDVWKRAVELAGGESPSERETKLAVHEFLARHKAPLRNVAADSRTSVEKLEAQGNVFVAEFEAIMHANNRLAGKILDKIIEIFNAHQDTLQESA
jgi:hypothetical protein